MNLKNQRRIAAQLLKCSVYRVWFDDSRKDDIKEAITKVDLRALISEGAIKKKPVKGISRSRVRLSAYKKRRGQGKGQGSRKGKSTARLSKKERWMNQIRSQRRLLRILKEKGAITSTTFRSLYLKSKGGFFRNLRHIKLYVEEHKLIKK